MKKSVIIIGGGAAGFFCGANLDENKYNITILEQNKNVLQKVKISGGGRCNVSHACFNTRDLIQFYPRGHKELLSVFTKFQPSDTIEWFEKRNIRLKIENDNRIFPESNSSQSIINCFLKEVERKNISVLTQQNVSEITFSNHQYTIKTKENEFLSDYIVFTPGSSAKSLKIIENMGHKIIAPVPSLFTFNTKHPLIKELSGTSFPNASIKICELKTQENGPLLITHWGLSGPVILKTSAWEAIPLAQKKYQFQIIINFIGIDSSSAEHILTEYKTNNPKKNIGSCKIFDITNRFWERILDFCKIDKNKNISNLSKEEIRKISSNLCQSKMNITGKSTFKEEFVTAGGVNLKEIDFKTMKSKILPNFYMAGEVLNIDGVTGGFNFQACWSEAWLISQHLNQL